jgi:hypothetical protein
VFENLNRASPQRFSTGSLGRLLDNHERLVDVTEANPWLPTRSESTSRQCKVSTKVFRAPIRYIPLCLKFHR